MVVENMGPACGPDLLAARQLVEFLTSSVSSSAYWGDSVLYSILGGINEAM